MFNKYQQKFTDYLFNIIENIIIKNNNEKKTMF